MESSDIYKLVIFYIIIISLFYYKMDKNLQKRKLQKEKNKKIKNMNSDEIVNELINDFKIISFGVGYELDLSKEEQIKNLRYCLLFANQMIVNCESSYRKIYLEVVEKLNLKLKELQK